MKKEIILKIISLVFMVILLFGYGKLEALSSINNDTVDYLVSSFSTRFFPLKK